MGKSGNPAKRAQQETESDAPVYEPGETADEYGTEDFDAFWSSRTRRVRKTRVMGQDVILPPALPLRFEMEARRVERSKSEEDVRRLVGILFGEDALDGWIERGMDSEQFAVLLAWGPRKIAGHDITLAEVADMLERAQTEDPQ